MTIYRNTPAGNSATFSIKDPQTTASPLRKAAAITVASLSAFYLAACSGQSDAEESSAAAASTTNNAATQTVVETTVTETEKSPASDSAKKGSNAGANSGNHGSSTSEKGGNVENDLTNALSNGVSQGETFTAGGEKLTACLVGDGYALNIVAAASHTSCDFALEIMNTQVRGLNATEDSIRDNLSPHIKAHSKATGKTYDVSCREDSDGVIICTGGNNGKVIMN